MAFVLGIETSCDETAAAVYDTENKRLVSSSVFSQVSLHEIYGGVVPEIASRSHLQKIGPIVKEALRDMSLRDMSLDAIEYVAVTNKPGLAGALLVGHCFAKGLAWGHNKKLITVDHLEAHIFSSFLADDVSFPHLALLVSGGHTMIFYVEDFGVYRVLGQTLDDAAGEAFDKVAKLIGLGYPGGPKIEALARQEGFEDFFSYPRTKQLKKTLDFSFSGLKTAVLYDLVKKGAYDLHTGIIKNNMSPTLQRQVSSSLLVCIADILQAKVSLALEQYPEVKAVTFTGGVACNGFLCERLRDTCEKRGVSCVVPPKKYCGDNAAMVAFVGGYKAAQQKFADISVDVYE